MGDLRPAAGDCAAACGRWARGPAGGGSLVMGVTRAGDVQQGRCTSLTVAQAHCWTQRRTYQRCGFFIYY